MVTQMLPIDLTNPGTATFSCGDTQSQQADWNSATMIAYEVTHNIPQ
jgi:hypothetical protein